MNTLSSHQGASQRTPGPWVAEEFGSPRGRWYVRDANGKIFFSGLTESDAAFIVKACNAHDDLIAALCRAVEHHDLGPARALLAKVQS